MDRLEVLSTHFRGSVLVAIMIARLMDLACNTHVLRISSLIFVHLNASSLDAYRNIINQDDSRAHPFFGQGKLYCKNQWKEF